MSAPSIYACVTTRDGAIRTDVMECLVNAVNRAAAAGVKVGAGRQQFAHGTAVCRNKAVADFLGNTDLSHLLFIDDDVLLPLDTIHYLAESLADPAVAVVCGAYPTYKLAGRNAFLYLTARPVGGDWLTEWPAGLVEVDAGGTGCMAIRRDVFEAVGFPWFRWPEQWDKATGTVQWVSDDVDFCAAARGKGFKVWCDGRVQPGHLKLTDLKLLLNGAMKWKESPAAEDDAYGSHAGALRRIGQRLPIRSVVEYGAGWYSTPLFLDREAFPDVGSVQSYECNPEWAAKVRGENADPRLNLVEMPLRAFRHAVPTPDPDLVFIDCDEVKGGRHDFSERAALIAEYARHPSAVVVVHDANFTDIRPAVLAAPYKHKITVVPPVGPHTAVMSNAVDVGTVLA